MTDKSYEWKKFGRYALLQKIGSGGMAEIYRAKTFGAAGFEKEFAIKLILPGLVDDTEFVDMFINEAKLTVNLYHANIVQVFDLGELNNQYYIAMEYVHGKDLLYVLARCAELNIKIPLDIALFVAMEMLKGLDFAHRATDPYGEALNIIHRDVSPSNIMISYAGDVKVGDFGVAKAAIERTLTETGTLKGKVGYMSPEQVMGNEIDSRSDLFSACIVLFESLSMNRLFIGNSDLDVMLKVRDADISDSLRQAGPMPSQLVDIVHRGLAKHREDRFQTGGEFYQALVDFCFQHSIKVTGSDLSNFMRRLFSEEIEKEKRQRRSEPGGEALSRQMAIAEEKEQRQARSAQSKSPVPAPEKQAPERKAPNIKGEPVQPSQKEPTGEPPSDSQERAPDFMALKQTAKVKQPPDAEQPSKQPSRAGVLNVPTGKERRAAEANKKNGDEKPKRYRYRDSSGLVFGPMGPETLVNLLRLRRPRADDRISVNDGRWVPVDEVDEIDINGEPNLSDRRARRHVSVEASTAEVQDTQSRRREEDDAELLAGDTDAAEEHSKSAGHSDTSDASDQSSEFGPSGIIAGADRGLANSSTELAPPPEMSEASSDQGREVGDSESPTAESAPALKPNELGASTSLQELKDQYASYEGDIQKIPFAKILARLHLVKETGRLHVQRDEIEKSIFFRDGEPIFVHSNKKDELLGQFMRSRDVITQAQLDEALDRLSEWGGRLGDALVAVGALQAHSIFEHLSVQMREKLLDIFSWEAGYYGYYENQEPDYQAYSLGMNSYEILVEGCRERVHIDRIRDAYKNRMFVRIYINDPPPFDVDKLGLRARELRVLKELESGGTIEEVIEQFPFEHHETVFRTIYLLHHTALVSFEVTQKFSMEPSLPALDFS